MYALSTANKLLICAHVFILFFIIFFFCEKTIKSENGNKKLQINRLEISRE